jgi:hypothetical protein
LLVQHSESPQSAFQNSIRGGGEGSGGEGEGEGEGEEREKEEKITLPMLFSLVSLRITIRGTLLSDPPFTTNTNELKDESWKSPAPL